ncbi:hypothetical protein D9M68_919300 [compost metagenome]
MVEKSVGLARPAAQHVQHDNALGAVRCFFEGLKALDDFDGRPCPLPDARLAFCLHRRFEASQQLPGANVLGAQDGPRAFGRQHASLLRGRERLQTCL